MSQLSETSKKRLLRILVQFAAIGLLIWADQAIKRAVAASLPGRGSVPLIRGFLGLCYAENTGAAFSMFTSNTAALSAVTGAALTGGLIALIAVKKMPRIYAVCIPLIIAGGAGNLIDRLRFGYVIDYIQTLFIDFPVFNFADSLITCSCITLIVYLLVEIVRDGRKKKRTPPQEEPTDG